MLNLLSKTKKHANFEAEELGVLLAKIAQIYDIQNISQDRKVYLSKCIKRYGYLPYPQFKVLQELTDAEAIFCLIKKMANAKTFVENKIISFKNPSYLARKNIKNSSWFKHEGHNIKLLSLSALGDGNSTDSPANFIDWIKCRNHRF